MKGYPKSDQVVAAWERMRLALAGEDVEKIRTETTALEEVNRELDDFIQGPHPAVEIHQTAPTRSDTPPFAHSTAAETSSPGLLATVGSGTQAGFSVFLWIFFFLCVTWGMYWGCQLVYPRILAWYNSSTFLVFGTGPMDILKRQILMGLQVRLGAIVIGTIVGCLGGAFYMQFFRSTPSMKVQTQTRG